MASFQWPNSGGGSFTSLTLTVPSFLSVSPATLTGSGTFAITLSGTALPLSSGGTGSAGFSTAGSLVYYNGSRLTSDVNTSLDGSGGLSVATLSVNTSITAASGLVTSPAITTNKLSLNTSQSSLSGGTAGTALASMPMQGSSLKKAVVYLNGFSTTSSTFTFPTAFVNAPFIYGTAGAIAVASSSTTVLTIASATLVTGWIFIEGY